MTDKRNVLADSELKSPQPGELWSLWDMLAVEVGNIATCSSNLSVQIQGWRTVRAFAADNGTTCVIQKSDVDIAFQSATKIQQLARDYGLETTGAASDRLLQRFQSLQHNAGIIVLSDTELELIISQAMRLVENLSDECCARQFLLLTSSDAALYKQPLSVFTNEVVDSFPDAQFDLEEAGMCLALGRYTACVFHLMRAMESGVRLLANHLNVTIASKHGETLAWGILASNIGTAIKQMEKGSKRDEWHNLHALLVSANRAWRTKTAHPEKTYTEEHAREAVAAVKSFLSKMAEIIS